MHVLNISFSRIIYIPGYGRNELSVPRGWTDFRDRRDKLLEALPIVIMGYWILRGSLPDQQKNSC